MKVTHPCRVDVLHSLTQVTWTTEKRPNISKAGEVTWTNEKRPGIAIKNKKNKLLWALNIFIEHHVNKKVKKKGCHTMFVL